MRSTFSSLRWSFLEVVCFFRRKRRRMAASLRWIYHEIGLARDGGLTVEGVFHPLPEGFLDTPHVEAFSVVGPFAFAWPPEVLTLRGIGLAYPRHCGPEIPIEVWREVLDWFVGHGLLARAAKEGREATYLRPWRGRFVDPS